MLVTYNLRSYIEECLDSIMVNLDEDIELIVVDDGSCDGTALMLDLRTDFSLPCKLIAEGHFLYDSIFTRI